MRELRQIIIELQSEEGMQVKANCVKVTDEGLIGYEPQIKNEAVVQKAAELVILMREVLSEQGKHSVLTTMERANSNVESEN